MLDPNDMRLRDLINWLITPARCGIYLSTADLARIGASLGIRIAPMSRYAGVEQLFRSAAIDDTVDDLFAAFQTEFESHIATYDSCNSPALIPWISRSTAALDTWGDVHNVWREQDTKLQS